MGRSNPTQTNIDNYKLKTSPLCPLVAEVAHDREIGENEVHGIKADLILTGESTQRGHLQEVIKTSGFIGW